MAERTATPRFKLIRSAVLLILFAAMACVVWWLWDQNRLTSAGAIQAVREHPLLAPAVFVALYAVAMFFVIPTLPLNVGAGFLWGSLLGAVYTVLGTTLGACCAFLFARTALGQPLARGFNLRILGRMARAVSHSGWKVMAFARLNPLVPTGLANFFFGLTSLGLWTFCWGTLCFSFPLAYVVACLGASTGSFLLLGNAASLFRIGGVIVGMVLLVAAAKFLLPADAGHDPAKPDSEA